MYLLEWDRQWIREDFLKGCEMLIEIFNDSQNEELYGYSVKKVPLFILLILSNRIDNCLPLFSVLFGC